LTATGKVVEWGKACDSDVCNQPPAATASDVAAIAAGWGHSVALKRDGSIVEWGRACTACPYPQPADLQGVVAVAAGDYHTLVLRNDGGCSLGVAA
jgi:alpha-tubulin suppressor-like RCC1 family protein